MKAATSMRRQAGFSLLEAIVTLVIFSMLVTLLMQSLQQALGVRERVFVHQRWSRIDALQARWFRDSIESAITNPDVPADRFEGDGERLRLVSQSPLEGHYAAVVEWSLKRRQGGYYLHYRTAEWQGLVVMEGPLRQAAFAYLDADGQWRSKWAPAPADRLRLPRAVRLLAETGNGPLAWLVTLPVEKSPPSLLLPKEETFQ